MVHRNHTRMTALDIAFAMNHETAISKLLNFAWLNKLNPDSIMPLPILEKALAWSKEQDDANLVSYLQYAKNSLTIRHTICDTVNFNPRMYYPPASERD